jgi:hypothetical protein
VCDTQSEWAIWKKWSGYHRRSLVETKMRCFKLLRERVLARDFDRQVADLQVRAAVLNRFTRLDTPITVPVLLNRPKIASSRFSLDLLNKAGCEGTLRLNQRFS